MGSTEIKFNETGKWLSSIDDKDIHGQCEGNSLELFDRDRLVLTDHEGL